MSTNQNTHFSQLPSQIQKSPQDQRAGALIDGIANQMAQSSDPGTQQLGTELRGLKTQLANAVQQQS